VEQRSADRFAGRSLYDTLHPASKPSAAAQAAKIGAAGRRLLFGIGV